MKILFQIMAALQFNEITGEIESGKFPGSVRR